MEFKTVEAAEALPLLKKHFNWLTEKYNRAPGLLPIYQKLLKGIRSSSAAALSRYCGALGMVAF